MAEHGGRRNFLIKLFSLSAFAVGSTVSLSINNVFNPVRTSQAEAKEGSSTGGRVKKISVEEHYYTEEFLKLVQTKTDHKGAPSPTAAVKVVEYGEGRIREMDECGVDMQILSLSYPALEPFKKEDAVDVSKMMNDVTSEAVKKHPDRFAGFCCIPLQNPDAAADELERAVTKLGLKGAMVNINTPGRWLSDQKYEVIFERLNSLNVPFYLHTDGPSTEDSGLHIVPEVMRLVNGNLLDKYPNLTLILGHAGESLPFWLTRLDGRWRNPDRPTFSHYFKKHFYVSTSSQCSHILLQFLIASVGAERILFAMDYPYESMKQHVDFIDTAPISESDRNKICHSNAEKLFKL